MRLDVWLVFVHLIFIVGTASLLVAEVLICRAGIAGAALRRLARIDLVYAAFAVAALASGATLVFAGSKGSSYYLHNPLLHVKFTLYVVIALLSIAPTLRYMQWSKAAQRHPGYAPDAAAVTTVRRLLHAELLLLALLPLLGAGIARGVTRFGQLF